MAIKEKPDKKQNKLLEILGKEYKWENYLLLVVALIALALASMILLGELVPNVDFPIIGSYPNLFAWVLMGVSVFGLLLVLIPFLKPVYPEFTKITWATKKEFIENSIRVFVFIIILAVFFLLSDILIRAVVDVIRGRS